MWTTLQIVLIALGLLLAYLGNQFSMPILFSAGVGCLGLAMMVSGWEAILTRHMVLRRRRGARRTYTGIAAIFQGIQFNFIGLFLIALAFIMYFDNGQGISQQMARRPGLLLVLLGGLCLLQAGITLSGSREMSQGSQGLVMINLVVARLLPGLILVVIGLGLGASGLFETLAPARFDEMGGALLEQLYSAR